MSNVAFCKKNMLKTFAKKIANHSAKKISWKFYCIFHNKKWIILSWMSKYKFSTFQANNIFIFMNKTNFLIFRWILIFKIELIWWCAKYVLLFFFYNFPVFLQTQTKSNNLLIWLEENDNVIDWAENWIDC